MKRLFFMFVSALICGMVCTSCGSEKAEKTGNEEFCLYLNSENMDKTIPIFNDYLAGLKSNLNDEEKLQSFSKWLTSASCVIDVTILCISCIYTLPAQSEISILFEEDGITVEVILDILMTNPLKAGICSINYGE